MWSICNIQHVHPRLILTNIKGKLPFISGSADSVLWTKTKGTSVVTADSKSVSRLE